MAFRSILAVLGGLFAGYKGAERYNNYFNMPPLVLTIPANINVTRMDVKHGLLYDKASFEAIVEGDEKAVEELDASLRWYYAYRQRERDGPWYVEMCEYSSRKLVLQHGDKTV